MAQQLGSNYYNSPYKFNGKELDEETGFYYYGARYYDPRISIWQSVDPLAETMPFASPYNYCLQNPINLVDPDGKKPTDWYLNLFTGKITWKDGQGSRFMYKDLGFTWGSTDVNGNRFLMDGETKQISYNGTVLQDFNNNKSAFDISDGFTIWGKERSGDTSGLKGTTTDSFESDDVPTLGNGDGTFGSIFSKAETALKKLIKFFNITDGTLDTFDRGQGTGQQILNATKKANVEVEKPKKTEQTEFIYTNYDANNPNNNVQVRREDYEAQQKKKNERQ